MLFFSLLIDYYLKKCLVIWLRFSWHPLWIQALTYMFPQHCVVQCELTQYGQFRQLVVVPHSWSNVCRDLAWFEPSLSYICIVYSAEHPWKWHIQWKNVRFLLGSPITIETQSCMYGAMYVLFPCTSGPNIFVPFCQGLTPAHYTAHLPKTKRLGTSKWL